MFSRLVPFRVANNLWLQHRNRPGQTLSRRLPPLPLAGVSGKRRNAPLKNPERQNIPLANKMRRDTLPPTNVGKQLLPAPGTRLPGCYIGVTGSCGDTRQGIEHAGPPPPICISSPAHAHAVYDVDALMIKIGRGGEASATNLPKQEQEQDRWNGGTTKQPPSHAPPSSHPFDNLP